VNQQGIPYVIPLWAFMLAVCLPAIGLFAAEAWIWFKNRDK
jgi:hypothetical protein